MGAYKLALAVALLTSPDPVYEWTESEQRFHELAGTIQLVAIHWQILDPRETRFLLADPSCFSEDLEELRRRYKRLRSAPPISDCERFPCRKIVSEYLAWNRNYQRELKQRLEFDSVHRYELEQALAETQHLYEIWERVHDARRKFYYITVRRIALDQLRSLVGPSAYYSGQLPPPLPLWRLPRYREPRTTTR